MKYLKLFENNNGGDILIDEIKGIDHILTDEGFHMNYFIEKKFGDNRVDYRGGVLKIFMVKNIERDIQLSIGQRNVKYFNDMFVVMCSDYFQEYLDRLQEIFDGMDFSCIYMYINGEIIGSISEELGLRLGLRKR